MARDLEGMTIERVKGILSKSIGIDEKDLEKIKPETRLVDLGAGDMEFMDILYKLGVSIRNYIDDFETRKISGYEGDVMNIASWESGRGNSDQYNHLKRLAASKDASDLKEVLNVADCLSIGQYVEYRKSHSQNMQRVH